jgi:hypothetical protein
MKRLFYLSLIILCSCNNSLKAQKIDSLTILCRELSGESRGTVTKVMLVSRSKNERSLLCTKTIIDSVLTNNFLKLLKKSTRKKTSGIICNVLIRIYSNGNEKESICLDHLHMFRENGESYDSKKIVELLDLKNFCNGGCDRIIINRRE